MRLEDINIGEIYKLHPDAPTDLEDPIMQRTRPATVRDFLTDQSGLLAVPPTGTMEGKVLAVRVPYKRGQHGVLVRAERPRAVECVCSCGHRHPKRAMVERAPGVSVESFDIGSEPVEFTVHYSALVSLSEEIERHLMFQSAVRRHE